MTTTPSTVNTDPLLDPKEAAQYLSRDPRTMANDRSLGIGPRYARLGRLVRYKRSDLDSYIQQNMVEGNA